MTAHFVWIGAVSVWLFGSGVGSALLLGRLLVARRAGRLICRQVSHVEATLWVVMVVGFFAIGAALLGWTFGVASIGGVLLGEVTGLLTPARTLTGFYVWRRWRLHRPHDIDCEYGHSMSPKARARLVEWRKVALRPGLAPS